MPSKIFNFHFLATTHVKRLNRQIEGPSSIVRDEGLLESAVTSPENKQHYGGVNDLAELAAILSTKLIKNHAFGNGNKRTALLAANMFLTRHRMALKGDSLSLENENVLESAQNDVAQNKMDELELAAVYRTRLMQASNSQQDQTESLSKSV
ncbi:MAG: hypothetical protein Q9187_002901 [Circinaria calcarea]